ncbi:hypothetical protein L0152_30560 [bacterium]|nr:hypothetical protein [bacterium]
MIPFLNNSRVKVICGTLFSQVVALRVAVFLLLVPFVESQAQERWHVSFSGGVASPEFFINDALGYTALGSLYYNMWDTTQLSLSIGYSKWKENLGPGGTHFRSFPLLVGVRLPFPMKWGAPYLSGEVGLHFFASRIYL